MPKAGLIEYEMFKGEHKAYEAKLDSQLPTYIDGKLSKWSMIDTSQLGYLGLKNNPAKNVIDVTVFTKTDVLQKFKNTMKKVNPGFWRQIANESAKNFEQKYLLEINGSEVSHGFLFEKLYGVDTMKSVRAEIKKRKTGKKIIAITTY